MPVTLPYGRGHLTMRRTPDWVLTPRSDQVAADGPALVRAALDTPVGSPSLAALAEKARRVLIITSDHTRPVPSAITLPILLETIRAARPDAEIKILIATGMHRASTQEEMEAKYGAAVCEREELINHDSRDDSSMVYKGTLPSGGDLVVSEGFIEPHFFAGFSGGRKSVLPGIASYKTVLYNHNARFIADPRAVQGNLQGNPLHEDMRFAAKAAGLAFILNVILDEEKRIVAAFAGDPEAAHAVGCEACRARNAVRGVRADIVVTTNGGYPLDQNLYQAVKGMTAGEACVKPGGVLIMAAECVDGHGGEAFYRWMADAKGPREVLDAIASVPPDQTQVDQWEAQILARVLCHASVIFVTGEANRSMVEAMHMDYAPTLDEALDRAYAKLGPKASLCVIPDGVGVIVQPA
ncbi:MAG TPA: nickel-dependent lactate racemase [Clostridia bacterium]|nr:nickel-dependent lactate racemase [Clostridia bacterium]